MQQRSGPNGSRPLFYTIGLMSLVDLSDKLELTKTKGKPSRMLDSQPKLSK